MKYNLTVFVFFLDYYFLDAVPNKILELMNMSGLTRNNVASHLQVSSYLNPKLLQSR